MPSEELEELKSRRGRTRKRMEGVGMLLHWSGALCRQEIHIYFFRYYPFTYLDSERVGKTAFPVLLCLKRLKFSSLRKTPALVLLFWDDQMEVGLVTVFFLNLCVAFNNKLWRRRIFNWRSEFLCLFNASSETLACCQWPSSWMLCNEW